MPTSRAWFQGRPGTKAPDNPVAIDSIDRDKLFGAVDYDAEQGLCEAVNTALLLDQPLLLTGEPGTGKTQLGEKLALELGLPLFKFETKSSSVAQDLFYSFDHVARFQAAQISKEADALHPLRFLEFGALGRAVVQSLPLAQASPLFAAGALPGWYKGPGRAVVLIDEIDKAPSDFPNDALNEIERHYFRIREWQGGHEVKASAQLKPVVVITSNSEKQLPDAFLRRCIFYHLNPVTRERLLAITLRRLNGLNVEGGPMLNSALKLFETLRSGLDLRKRPSTSEFLAFVATLTQDPEVSSQRPLPAQAALRALAVLVKAPEDQKAARAHVLQVGASTGSLPT
jgi:MoxR-like ATPase